MIVYDTANKLAKELKECEEYIAYKKAKEEIKQMPEWNEKIKLFEEKRNELQMISLQGGTPLEEKAKEVQNMYAQLMQEEQIKAYFEAEFKFSVVLADINRMIGEAIRDVMQ